MRTFHKLGMCSLLTLSLFTHATDVPTQGKAEVIFINLWDEYAQPTSLPKADRAIPRFILQPDINVNPDVISGFVEAYPQFSGLQIDNNQSVAFRYRVWQTPSRIIIKDGEVTHYEFLGTDPAQADISHENILSDKGDQTITLKGRDGTPHVFGSIKQKRVLFFSDALCPFQHLPDCEKKIATNNQLASDKKLPVMTIIKPFYITDYEVQSYQTRFEVNHKLLLDQQNALFQKYQVTSLPYWLVVDEKGNELYRGEDAPPLL